MHYKDLLFEKRFRRIYEDHKKNAQIFLVQNGCGGAEWDAVLS